eukprot:SAG31_NODE_2351_length_5889_cov_1.999482_3_plen_51_part_00
MMHFLQLTRTALQHDVAAGADGNAYNDDVFPPSQYDIVDVASLQTLRSVG